MENTGDKAYRKLEQYDPTTGAATGEVKYNHPSDPDYVPPVYDETYCPLPASEPPPPNSLTITPTSYEAGFIDSFSIDVTANGSWAVSADQPWVTLSMSGGGETQSTLVDVTLGRNNTSYVRSAKIEFYMDGVLMATCYVNQQSEF